MKARILGNLLWTVSLFGFGLWIVILHFSKWVPFANYSSSNLAATLDLLWAYAGWFVGMAIATFAVFRNLLFRAALLAWSKR